MSLIDSRNSRKVLYSSIDSVLRPRSSIELSNLLDNCSTYHRNVALAMIQDYEDFQHLQDISLSSAGTAAERYEAYTESIAAKSAQLNTALKKMFSGAITSDLVTSVKGATAEVVTFIDNYEILQNLLKSAVIYGAAKGFIYLGGTIKDAYASIKTMSQAFNAMTMLSNSANGTTAYQQSLASLITYSQGLSDSQIKLLFSTKKLTEAQMLQILEMRGLSEQEAAATLATMGLTQAEGVATTATFSLSGAFRALSATISANPIGAVATAAMTVLSVVSILKRKSEEAAEAERELQEQVEQNISQYQNEESALNELIAKYSELSSKAKEDAGSREELSKLQSQIVTNYGQEAETIDLVNGKYSEQIEQLYALKKAKADAFVNDAKNIEAYQNALEKINNAGDINSDIDVEISYKGGIPQEIIDKWKELQIITDSVQYSMSRNDYGFAIEGGNDITTLYETLNKMAESYKELSTEAGNYNEQQYTAIKQQAIALEQTYRQYQTIVDAFEQNKQVVNFELSIEEQEQFDTLLDKANELNSILASDASSTQKYQATQQLSAIKNELVGIAGENGEMLNVIDSVFSAVQDGADVTFTTIDDLRTAWFNSLDEMQKGSLANADKMQKALQTIADDKLLSSNDFWELAELDTDRVMQNVKAINGQFHVNRDELLRLKDTYINSQISIIEEQQAVNKEGLKGLRAERDMMLEQLAIKQAIIKGGAYYSPSDITSAMSDVQRIKQELIDNENGQAQYNEQIRNTNLLVDLWRSKLGDTVDKTNILKNLQNQVNEAQKKADASEKAIKSAIDDNIKSLNAQKSILNDEKEALNDQLQTLEEQKKVLESTIKNYKDVANTVKAENDKIIDDLEERQKAEEQAIQVRIDALKAGREEQEKENSLAEKELEVKQKLADLEKAKNTKVRTYSASTGWTYETDKQGLIDADTALDKAQKDYDKAVDDYIFEKQMQALEDEKAQISLNYDEQIKSIEEYTQLWMESIEEQTNAEKEQLAEQILGSQWREKIKNKDTAILNKFKTNMSQYNNQLNSLVANEIATLNESIKAKNEELKAIEQQIKGWQDYKTQVEDTISAIKQQYDSYYDDLDRIALKENASYEERQQALQSFAANYQGYIDTIASLQSQIDDASAEIVVTTNIPEVSEEMANFIDSYRDAIESMQRSLDESLTGYGVVNSAWDARLAAAANALRRGYASGGVADYTGLAMLHGTKNASETIFNAAQSKSLYDMVNTGEFSSLVASRALDGIATAVKTTNVNKADNSSIVNNIHQEFHNVNDPVGFAQSFSAEMKKYWRNKATESKVY